jgi:hypothetical protein
MSQTIRIESGSLGLQKRLISFLALLVVLVGARDNQRRLWAIQAVERLFIERRCFAVHGYDLRFKAVGLNELRIVLDEIETDVFDAFRSSRYRSFAAILLLDGFALFIGSVREDAVEDGVERVADDAQIRKSAFVKDRNGCAVAHGLFDRVRIDVGAEGLQGRAILFIDRRARKSEKAGVWEAFSQVGSKTSVLRAVRFVRKHEEVGRGR